MQIETMIERAHEAAKHKPSIMVEVDRLLAQEMNEYQLARRLDHIIRSGKVVQKRHKLTYREACHLRGAKPTS